MPTLEARRHTGAWGTPDDDFASGQYDIGWNTLSLVTQSSYTLPSSIDFEKYWETNDSNAGRMNFNRQNNDNGGRGVSSLVIYKLRRRNYV